MDKLKILFYNTDIAGVNYFRTQTPAIELERQFSNEFQIEIKNKLDFNEPETVEYLKSFDIIQYHRQLAPDIRQMKMLKSELKNTVFVSDIDDYWFLPKQHPYHYKSIEQKTYVPILENLQIADYVTTTTNLFADTIKVVTKKDNVRVFPNSVNPEWMDQFKDNHIPDPDGKVRITYMAGSCYDDKTEVFTENGWKLFKDLNSDERVATLNPENNQFEYQLPTEFINEPYSGDMYYGKNSLIDFAVTPNHNMYIHSSKHLNRKKPFSFKLQKMENLEDFDLTFKKNCDWIGKNEEYMIIPKHITTEQHADKCGEIKMKMNDWLKFLGFWMGDGWTTNGSCRQIGICGFKEIGIETMKEIKQIFDEYNISSTYTKDGNSLRFFNIPLFNYLNKFGCANEKYIPREILDLSKEKLEIFLEYYLRADGHVRKNGRKTAYTSSKMLADNLNEIALKLGVSATIKNRGIRKGDKYIKGRLINQRYDSYDINFYLNSRKGNLTPTLPSKNIIKKKYDGNIYCVTVPNHILYVRRNGLSYWCGNSHFGDIQQLHGVFNVLYNDPQLKGKFKVILAGWDTEGKKTEITFNEDFRVELERLNLWSNEAVRIINTTKGDVDKMPFLPENLKNKYRGNVFQTSQRKLESEESIYLDYEKILTSNHNIVEDEDYKLWLMNFERGVYENETTFARRWTEKANKYATTLNETDIALAPLSANDFNFRKSNLKQVECWTRKLPIVCNDIPPYNVDGIHMKNCMLVPNKKNARKYWQKYIKSLILDSDLRKELGNQLYEDFKVKYNLKYVTQKRAEFYKSILKK